MKWMEEDRSRQLAVVLLRMAGLLSRLVLTVAVARYLSLGEVGRFSIYSAALVLAFSIAGLEVYTVSSRELVGVGKEEAPGIVGRHLGLVAATAAGIGGPLALVLAHDLAGLLLIVLAIHAISEGVGQDIARLLVPLGRPVGATLFTFVRTALWAIVFAGVSVAIPAARNVSTLVGIWLSSSILATVGGWLVVRAAVGRIVLTFDRLWLKRSVRAAVPFFVGSLGLRILLGGDRLAVAQVLTLEEVGVYGVYASFAFAAISVVDASVLAFRYPRYVGRVIRGECSPYNEDLRAMGKECGVAAIAILSLGLLLARPFFEALGEPAYAMNWSSFAVLLCGVAIYVILLPAHFVLYALRRDGLILVGNMLGAVVFIVMLVALGRGTGVLGAATATGVGVAMVGLTKCVMACRRWSRAVPSASTLTGGTRPEQA